MGSNEVIIDGCNVAECENLEQNNACNEYLDGCCEGHNCLYKQLQRAKVENEKLKESLKIAEELCRTLEKAKTNEHYQWFDRCCEINNECDKYKQALEDIKVKFLNQVTFVGKAYKFKEEILNKINEVLE